MSHPMHKDERARFLSSEEGGIFATGCFMLIGWIAAVALLWQYNTIYWMKLLTMGFSHGLAGRAMSIARGTSVGFSPALTAGLAIYFDVMLLFIIYPLLIYSYKHFLEQRFFKEHMKPVFDSVRKNLTRFRKAKIVGVFIFVWIPLWMTGITFGAVLGYLLGLRTWVNLTTVILGSSAAVICWVYAYDKIFGWLGNINKAIPSTITAIVIIVLVAMRIIKQCRQPASIDKHTEDKEN